MVPEPCGDIQGVIFRLKAEATQRAGHAARHPSCVASTFRWKSSSAGTERIERRLGANVALPIGDRRRGEDVVLERIDRQDLPVALRVDDRRGAALAREAD